ncbi:hypothetical protein O181_050620 [Austropuccinia psidii MF-1]|uniref:Uncharacterized protein n=1 Tax=Austropuccinia psidii MF-1 TaxID=1389203 RepID=A0A9Q3E1E4_9BASI|nr:hypothetical protein [Austropuccinia psidii MF-1]
MSFYLCYGVLVYLFLPSVLCQVSQSAGKDLFARSLVKKQDGKAQFSLVEESKSVMDSKSQFNDEALPSARANDNLKLLDMPDDAQAATQAFESNEIKAEKHVGTHTGSAKLPDKAQSVHDGRANAGSQQSAETSTSSAFAREHSGRGRFPRAPTSSSRVPPVGESFYQPYPTQSMNYMNGPRSHHSASFQQPTPLFHSPFERYPIQNYETGVLPALSVDRADWGQNFFPADLSASPPKLFSGDCALVQTAEPAVQPLLLPTNRQLLISVPEYTVAYQHGTLFKHEIVPIWKPSQSQPGESSATARSTWRTQHRAPNQNYQPDRSGLMATAPPAQSLTSSNNLQDNPRSILNAKPNNHPSALLASHPSPFKAQPMRLGAKDTPSAPKNSEARHPESRGRKETPEKDLLKGKSPKENTKSTEISPPITLSVPYSLSESKNVKAEPRGSSPSKNYDRKNINQDVIKVKGKSSQEPLISTSPKTQKGQVSDKSKSQKDGLKRIKPLIEGGGLILENKPKKELMNSAKSDLGETKTWNFRETFSLTSRLSPKEKAQYNIEYEGPEKAQQPSSSSVEKNTLSSSKDETGWNLVTKKKKSGYSVLEAASHHTESIPQKDIHKIEEGELIPKPFWGVSKFGGHEYALIDSSVSKKEKNLASSSSLLRKDELANSSTLKTIREISSRPSQGDLPHLLRELENAPEKEAKNIYEEANPSQKHIVKKKSKKARKKLVNNVKPSLPIEKKILEQPLSEELRTKREQKDFAKNQERNAPTLNSTLRESIPPSITTRGKEINLKPTSFPSTITEGASIEGTHEALIQKLKKFSISIQELSAFIWAPHELVTISDEKLESLGSISKDIKIVIPHLQNVFSPGTEGKGSSQIFPQIRSLEKKPTKNRTEKDKNQEKDFPSSLGDEITQHWRAVNVKNFNLAKVLAMHLEVFKKQNYLSLESMSVNLYEMLRQSWKSESLDIIKLQYWARQYLGELEGSRRVWALSRQILRHTIVRNWSITKECLIREDEAWGSKVEPLEQAFQLSTLSANFDLWPDAFTNFFFPEEIRNSEGLTFILEFVLGSQEADARIATGLYMVLNQGNDGWLEKVSMLKTVERQGLNICRVLDISSALHLEAKEDFTSTLGNKVALEALRIIKSHLIDMPQGFVSWYHSPERAWLIKTYGNRYRKRFKSLCQLPIHHDTLVVEPPHDLAPTHSPLRVKLGAALEWYDSGLELDQLPIYFSGLRKPTPNGVINWNTFFAGLPQPLTKEQENIFKEIYAGENSHTVGAENKNVRKHSTLF